MVECSVGSFYTQRFWKLICLHLPTDCFIEISPQSTGHIAICPVDWGEISMKQSVGKCKQTSRIFVYIYHIDMIYTLYICTIYTKILEVNLFAFAYRLFHRDFSPINGTHCI